MSGAAIAGVCGLGPIFVDSMEEEGYGEGLRSGAYDCGLHRWSYLSAQYTARSVCDDCDRFPASSLCWGVGPGILMSAMLLFYVLLVDKKKLVNPPMAKAMMKEERSIRELFFRVLPIAIAPSPDSDYDAVRNLQPGRDRRHGCALYMLLLGICHRSLTWSGFWRCVKKRHVNRSARSGGHYDGGRHFYKGPDA